MNCGKITTNTCIILLGPELIYHRAMLVGLAALLRIGGVEGAHLRRVARGKHSRTRAASNALNLKRHYIVTSQAAVLNIAGCEEMNGSLGYYLMVASFRQSFRLRRRLNIWFCGVPLGGVKLRAVLLGKMAAPC